MATINNAINDTCSAGITVSGGAVAINSGTSACGLSTDASATTVSIATGGAAKTLTIGSTNTTSSTAIKSGSGNVAINSGFTIDSTGRNYNSVQPCFMAYLGTSVTNATGDGTNYKIIFDNESFDQGSNFASGVFTAPIAGKYMFTGSVQLSNLGVAHTTSYLLIARGAFAEYTTNPYVNPIASAALSPAGTFGMNGTLIISLAASDVVSLYVNVTGSTKTVTVNGNGGTIGNGYPTLFAGYLIC